MAVEERRRIALHRAAAELWGEEVADTLIELVAPSGQDLATREDIRGVLAAIAAMDERWSEQLTAMDERWSERLTAMDERWSERLTAMEQRWQAEMHGLRHELLAAFEHGIANAVTHQTRTLVISQLVALVVIAGLAFSLS